MKKHSLILLIIILPTWLYAQAIKGKVLVLGTNTPVAGASIYFSGSSKGTSSTADGLFNLTSGQTRVPLIISCIGYYSATVTDYTFTEPLVVYLKVKENLMREVQIGNDGLTLELKMRMFREQFIGTSSYAESCTIINPDDVELKYKKKSGTLVAFATKPLIITNKKLGYTINYYLDTFVMDKAHVFFAGNSLFKDDVLNDAKLLKKIKRNREDAYQGSRLQFIRMLWRRKLGDLFEVYGMDGKSLTMNDLVVRDSASNKYLRLNGHVFIARLGDDRYTQLNTISKYSYIDRTGYYGPDLVWVGPMSLQRIGDMLPFEYVSTKDND